MKARWESTPAAWRTRAPAQGSRPSMARAWWGFRRSSHWEPRQLHLPSLP